MEKIFPDTGTVAVQPSGDASRRFLVPGPSPWVALLRHLSADLGLSLEPGPGFDVPGCAELGAVQQRTKGNLLVRRTGSFSLQLPWKSNPAVELSDS